MKVSLLHQFGSTGQTLPIKSGGVDVDFGPQHNPAHLLPYRVSVNEQSLDLVVEAWDWDLTSASDLIGRGTTEISHVIGKEVTDEEIVCPIFDDSGRSAGFVTVRITAALGLFGPPHGDSPSVPPPVPQPVEQVETIVDGNSARVPFAPPPKPESRGGRSKPASILRRDTSKDPDGDGEKKSLFRSRLGKMKSKAGTKSVDFGGSVDEFTYPDRAASPRSFAEAVDDDKAPPPMVAMPDVTHDASSRFDSAWQQLWDHIRFPRRGADVIVHLGGQVDVLDCLDDQELADVTRREVGLDGILCVGVICWCPSSAVLCFVCRHVGCAPPVQHGTGRRPGLG